MSVVESFEGPGWPNIDEAAKLRDRFRALDFSYLEKLGLPRIGHTIRRANAYLATWALAMHSAAGTRMEEAAEKAAYQEFVKAGKTVAGIILVNDLEAKRIRQATGCDYQLQLQVNEDDQVGVPIWAYEKHPGLAPHASPATLVAGETFPLAILEKKAQPLDPADVPDSEPYLRGPFVYLTYLAQPTLVPAPKLPLARLAEAVGRGGVVTMTEAEPIQQDFAFLGGVAIQESYFKK